MCREYNLTKTYRLGITMIVFGLLALVLLGAYLLYVANQNSKLEELNSALDDDVVAENIAITIDNQDDEYLPSYNLAKHFSNMHFGASFHPKYWHDPIKTGTDRRLLSELPFGFDLVSPLDHSLLMKPKGTAIRISIPALGIDSTVEELGIVDLSDSREYETPDHTVGHIPETADPGEIGNGWFFGHLESPFSGEGNVFRRLPEIPELLRDINEIGEGSIDIIMESSSGQYLYHVTSSEVLHADELTIYGSEEALISLVTCIPSLKYSHRLVIKGLLVGVKIE